MSVTDVIVTDVAMRNKWTYRQLWLNSNVSICSILYN